MVGRPFPRAHAGPAWTCYFALLLCGCDAAGLDRVSLGIVNGTEDGGDPAVVALVIDERIECSGALIADRVVVTAAHCVDGVEAADLSILFGQSLQDGGVTLGAFDIRQHAEFTGGSEHANDIAAVLLDAPAPADPLPMHRAPISDANVGEQVRLVGFGRTSPTDSAPRLKREGTAKISSVAETTFTLVPDPAITCVGDSGGPALLDVGAGEEVIGVLSLGDSDCATLSVETRMDAYAGIFLDPYIDATEAGTATLGERCFYDENCASGLCLPAVDLPSFSFCSSACGDPSECPPPLVCDVDSGAFGYCRPAEPSPGTLGTLCTDAYDCAAIESGDTQPRTWCDSPAGGAPDRCTVECEPDVLPCPDGYSCERSEHDGARACFVGAPQGCSCRAGHGGESGSVPLLLLLGWALIWVRASRRRS